MLGNAKIVEPGQWDHDSWNGRLLCWEEPIAGETYALGVDPGEGVGGDNSVCQVLKTGTLKHPDIQVAEFACNYLDPIEFGEIVNKIGRWYQDPDGLEAFLTVEINASCGDVMLNDLYNRLDYTNIFIRKHYDKTNNIYTNLMGWSTNRASRPKLIARGLHAFSYGDLVVNSEHLLREMQTFQRDGTIAKAKAMKGKHDDRLMALLICYWGAHDEEFLSGDSIGDDRRAAEQRAATLEATLKLTGGIEPEPEKPEKKPDYQAQAISYKEMYAKWEDSFFTD